MIPTEQMKSQPAPGESNGKKKPRASKPKSVDKVERIVRTLRCDLSEKEIRDRGDRAAHLLAKRDQKDADRKAAASQMGAEIKEVDAELRKVSTEVRDRASFRPVECEVRHDYRLGRVTMKRLDTKEVIEERPMQQHERQLPLSPPKAEKKPEEAKAKKADAKADKPKRERKPRAKKNQEQPTLPAV